MIATEARKECNEGRSAWQRQRRWRACGSLGEGRPRGDEEARKIVEQLNRDAGYEPVYAGTLENAAAQENFLKLMFAINQGGMGRFFYRIAPPDQL